MLGLFGVSFSSEHTFTDQEQRLYVAIADRAAVAIKNAELYERAQHAASLEERQRLARELHDSVSQALFSIALGAQTARMRIDNNPATAAEPIEYVMSLAQAGLAEMRALIFELRPESLENEGLVAALEKQAAATQARYSLPITLDLGEEPDAPLGVKEALYRIAQEAMHNVVKHASATQAGIKLSADGVGFILKVEDNGRGFDPDGAFPGHVGLISMRERAAKLGGTVSIISTPGAGTTVVALLKNGAS
jgi:signal transduction histidine kinase